MFRGLTEPKNNEERKANKKLRKLSEEERMEIERQRNEEFQIRRNQVEEEEQRKEEYKQHKIQERNERDRRKEIARKKENKQLWRQEEQRRIQEEEQRRIQKEQEEQEEQLRQSEEKRRAEEKRRFEKMRRLEEEMRIEEENRRKMQYNQILEEIHEEIRDLQLEYPDQPYRKYIVKLCKKYHPDKNPNANPEFINILHDMKEKY